MSEKRTDLSDLEELLHELDQAWKGYERQSAIGTKLLAMKDVPLKTLYNMLSSNFWSTALQKENCSKTAIKILNEYPKVDQKTLRRIAWGGGSIDADIAKMAADKIFNDQDVSSDILDGLSCSYVLPIALKAVNALGKHLDGKKYLVDMCSNDVCNNQKFIEVLLEAFEVLRLRQDVTAMDIHSIIISENTDCRVKELAVSALNSFKLAS